MRLICVEVKDIALPPKEQTPDRKPRGPAASGMKMPPKRPQTSLRPCPDRPPETKANLRQGL